jgi:HK97 family phage prohead protease
VGTKVAKRRIKAEVRATPEAGEGTFEAIVSVYNLAYEIGWGWKERILPGCFAESLAANDGIIPIFYEHDWDAAPIGDAVAEENSVGLLVRGQLYLGLGDVVDRVYRAMVAKALREYSIGFWPEEITWDKDEPEIDNIAKGDLAEASVVVRGANPSTETLDLRSQLVWIDGGRDVAEHEVARMRSLYVPEQQDWRADPAVIERAWAAMATPAGRELVRASSSAFVPSADVDPTTLTGGE